MIEEEKEYILSELRKIVEDNPGSFQLLTQMWDISAYSESTPNRSTSPVVEMGEFGSELRHSYPFYKPISKIIDPDKLNT